MFELIFWSVLIASLCMWYLLFGLESFLNGAMGGYGMPFRCLWDDLRFNLPGGWRRRLEATDGDEEWAREFPGWGHIVFMHMVIPFGPAALVLWAWQ